MKKFWNWFMTSNRYKHFIGGFVIGFFAGSNYCAAYSGVLVAASLEFKDKTWGGKWDWVDFGCTAVGAFFGRFLNITIVR